MRRTTSFLLIPVFLLAGFCLVDFATGGSTFFPRGSSPLKNLVSLTKADAVPDFAPHKALYDFRLIWADSSAGLNGMKGQLMYTQDDACDAWTSEHRFRTVYQYPERAPMLNLSTYASWEAKDLGAFHFRSERYENGMLAEALRGEMTRDKDGRAEVVYSLPEKLVYKLPAGYTLPAAQTNEIIARARKGDKIYNAVLFDGSDAEGPVEVNVFIGGKLTSEEQLAPSKGKAPIVAGLLTEAWRVRMAVFPAASEKNAEEDAMTPTYEMDMVLHANGVVSHAIIDYKTFKLEQKLTALEALPPKTCP